MMRRCLTLICLLCLLCTSFSFARAEEAAEVEFSELNEAGFLDEGEFLYENEEEGLWRYCGQNLRIEIRRRSQDKPKLSWLEAEIWTDGSEVFHMVPADPERRMTATEYPYKIARANRTVFAINNDYAQYRKAKKSKMGIIIREGKVFSTNTKAKNKTPFPNLDCLALYPDGDMKVFWSNEMTADEYLADGATDVLAFGPWLIRDGELNEAGIKKFATTKQPRTGIGMVEPGHYFAIVAEARIKRSNGVNVEWLAERFLELGCTVAFNLDGGETSGMVFMGHQLNKLKDKRNVSSRRTADIIGIGVSDLVRDTDAGW